MLRLSVKQVSLWLELGLREEYQALKKAAHLFLKVREDFGDYKLIFDTGYVVNGFTNAVGAGMRRNPYSKRPHLR